jgi:enoyl-CoA hydratase/carnithine racemase
MNPGASAMGEVLAEVRSGVGLLTLNRPRALNALSLPMIRELTAILRRWAADNAVEAVALRGQGRDGPFGAFCAGGDIRFFHHAALSGDAAQLQDLEDFFTEEYALNFLIHRFPKPYLVFMDGVTFGGGMGISGHGAANSLRIATDRTRMAMPETIIGLFPDVGGGWFLPRCPGRLGEYLALTGVTISGEDACFAGLADGVVPSADLRALWEDLATRGMAAVGSLRQRLVVPPAGTGELAQAAKNIERFFSLDSVPAIVHALEADASDWAQASAGLLRKRSPLMLHVTLEQVHRGRELTLADELRLERDLMWHCFHDRPAASGETVEGIRALAIDKDQAPRWNPARVEDVMPQQVAAFFESPWPLDQHPLRDLA